MSIVKLSAMPYAQAHVSHRPESIGLVSYTTCVATIDANGWLEVYGLHSMTTRRHIGAFVREYANISYQLARELYEKNMVYNIYTGEIRSL